MYNLNVHVVWRRSSAKCNFFCIISPLLYQNVCLLTIYSENVTVRPWEHVQKIYFVGLSPLACPVTYSNKELHSVTLPRPEFYTLIHQAFVRQGNNVQCVCFAVYYCITQLEQPNFYESPRLPASFSLSLPHSLFLFFFVFLILPPPSFCGILMVAGPKCLREIRVNICFRRLPCQ